MLRRSIPILLCVVMLPVGSLCADEVVRCESKGGRRICAADNIGSVVLKRQRSVAECREGQSWGYTRDAIWVDDGCRADFQVYTRRYGRERDDDRDRGRSWAETRGSRLICESDGGRQFCAADTHLGVTIARTLGQRDCIQGKSWGYNDRGVWVDRGCRAEFVIGDDRREERPAQVVLCESDYNKRRVCAADTRFGVELKRQVSRTDCVFNRTWGYDRDGVWVANGCRAEFLIRGR